MIRKVLLFLMVAVSLLVALAQETESHLVENAVEGRWYASPWIWVVGAALLIVALVALTKDKKD